MSRQVLNRGAYPNDPSAERLFDGVGKINEMTEELYKGVAHVRYDIAAPTLSASIRDDGAGNLALYVGAANAADGDQIKVAVFDNATGAMTVANGFKVAASNPRFSVSHTGVTPSTLRFGADAGVVWLGSQTNSPLYFITNNLERMRVDAAGNLGLGTTAPAAKLDVQGTALFNYAAGSSSGLLVPLPATYGKPSLQAVDSALEALAMILNPLGGSVGIGVDPLFKFHVKSGDGTGGLLHGLTKGVRFVFSPTESTIEGIDQTGSGALQPLTLGGSLVQLITLLQPKVHNAYDLGTTALRWKKLWAVDAEFTNSPIVPNVTAGDSTQKAANTKFVMDAIAGAAPVIGQHLRGSFTTLPPLCVWGNGQNLSRTTHAALMNATTIAGTVSTTNTSTSATLTLADAEAVAQVQVGMPIEATGIQAGTTISARGTATATTLVVTLSLAANATAGANATRVFPNGNGNGSTTFGVADLRDRTGFGRGNMGGTAANRITTGGSGINSSRIGAAGGDQAMQLHNHAKGIPAVNQVLVQNGSAVYALQGDGSNYNSNTGDNGSGSSGNIPPAIIENVAIFAGV